MLGYAYRQASLNSVLGALLCSEICLALDTLQLLYERCRARLSPSSWLSAAGPQASVWLRLYCPRTSRECQTRPAVQAEDELAGTVPHEEYLHRYSSAGSQGWKMAAVQVHTCSSIAGNSPFRASRVEARPAPACWASEWLPRLSDTL